ncbi:MAG: hypothetical protein JM57_10485 [Comamonadaceae bacterium BICA1-1]|nr:MAG: hypothetical protein JM57_10485 [Comamonadaceae bacterium BICA1-1]
MLFYSPLHRSHIVPGEAPLAHVPGSIIFWWAFFALGIVAFGAGLWGMVWRRVRRHRLRADLAQWPGQADRATQARFLIELVRRHRLKPPAAWVDAVDQAGQAQADLGNDDSGLNPLLALRDAIHEMDYVD